MGTEVTLFKDSAIISLTKGQQVIIDREDFPKISKHGWYSTIAPEGESKYLGMFLDPIDAATKYFGEFARLNF